MQERLYTQRSLPASRSSSEDDPEEGQAGKDQGCEDHRRPQEDTRIGDPEAAGWGVRSVVA